MANRTLRRPPNAIGNATLNHDGGSDSVERIATNESGSVTDNDRITDNIGDEPNERPNGVGNIRSVEIDPARLGEFIASGGTTGTDSGDSSGTKTRRRRADAGTRRGKRSKEAPQNVEALVSMVHTMASVFLSTPELQLADDETEKLSNAYTTFCEYHEVPVLTPKRMSEFVLIGCLCKLYVPRVIAIKNRKKQERIDKRMNGPQPIRNGVPHQPSVM